MTDHPRFQVVDSGTDELYCQYHGAPQVELVLRLVDWWLNHRLRRPFGERRIIPSSPEVTKQLSS